ncbi:hypothetical protein ACJMK2_033996 [Sinanodonta woodiana]|uniref:Uncharacterized protein n=1 Tax=Sinanodonta woodiana TaxID=1069815 RepID=A0ABD3WQ83_SINWO
MLMNLWSTAISRENWLPTDHTVIGSHYFTKEREREKERLCANTIQQHPVGKMNNHVFQANIERHQRLVEMEHSKKETLAAEAMPFAVEENNVPGTSTQTNRSMCDASAQTDKHLCFTSARRLAANRHFKVQLGTLQEEKYVLLNDLVVT